MSAIFGGPRFEVRKRAKSGRSRSSRTNR